MGRAIASRLAAIVLLAAAAACAAESALSAQRRTTPAQTQPARRAAAPAPPTVEPADVKCPMVLGEGARTGRAYCDVPIGNNAADGIIVTIPPHTGDVTLTFDLHNRHTYSEQQVRNKRGYHRYSATIGVMTMDTTLITRAAIVSEFRTEADLVDRIAGTGPGGLKAVAPTGTEPIVVTIPADAKAEAVSILGEKLDVVRVDEAGEEFTATGRPIAVISNVMLEYRPAARRAPRR
jgi:hypothetical protein